MISLHVLTPLRLILHVCIAPLARRWIIVYNTTPNPHLLYPVIRTLHWKS